MFYAVGISGTVYAEGVYRSDISRKLQDMTLEEPVMISRNRNQKPMFISTNLEDEVEDTAKIRSGAWTDEEDVFIVESYKELSAEELGECLYRTKSAVVQRIVHLRKVGKLTSPKKKKMIPWTEDELRLLDQRLSEGVRVKKIIEEMGRTRYSINNKISVIKTLGLEAALASRKGE